MKHRIYAAITCRCMSELARTHALTHVCTACPLAVVAVLCFVCVLVCAQRPRFVLCGSGGCSRTNQRDRIHTHTHMLGTCACQRTLSDRRHISASAAAPSPRTRVCVLLLPMPLAGAVLYCTVLLPSCLSASCRCVCVRVPLAVRFGDPHPHALMDAVRRVSASVLSTCWVCLCVRRRRIYAIIE